MQIKIESAVVQQAQARLRQQSGAMRAVAANVSGVLNGLDMQIAATQQIRQSLEALSRRCTTEQTQLEAMTQMLLAASDRFTQTDQKLGHRARGLGEAADAIGAGLAATTLPAVALRGIDRQKCADELGKTFGLRTSETLCDAQEHPQNYKNLVVRVAGFSSYFTRLYKGVQDEIIKRTEYQNV